MGESSLERKLSKPIFIFGCCNSGTTILWQTLKQYLGLSGPAIEGQDLKSLPDSMRHYLGNSTFRLWAHPRFELCYYRAEQDYNEDDKERITSIFLSHLKPDTRFITKSPADTLRARLIQAYFPDAYFLAIVRNGYAVSEGVVRKRNFDPDRPQFAGLHTTIEEAALQWLYSNIVILSHKDFLRRYKIILYEDLVAHPRDTLKSVLEFLELESNGSSIPTFETTLNAQQIARLKGDEIKTITRIAKPLLIHFGYDVPKKDQIDLDST